MSCGSCPSLDDCDPGTRASFASKNLYTWCTNCGNYGIFGAVKNALTQENKKPHEVLLAFDIGCNSNGADKISGYRFKGLHGRVIPFACGASIANEDVPVLAFAGDGATLGEGISHFVHAIRTNYNVTFILHNNYNYGLTTGQASPATPDGVPMKVSPYGTTAEQLNVSQLVMSLKPSFYGRSYSGHVGHMTNVIRKGMQHKGFSVIEVMQACPTFNKATPHMWYMERAFDISDIKDYDKTNLEQARHIANDLTKKIAIGVLYQREDMPDFMAKQQQREGVKTNLISEVLL
ncbi:2-oxoacid ferredoxin oxidoreductase [Candidatus Saccharibacteria bacterium]|jgi:2-oxoglutarate ferredoxin oxidoreductase subunit beta|nr:2-oxoacid ferredoxin oxidoreductase [Candidatus Saccharibacteria bacterium]